MALLGLIVYVMSGRLLVEKGVAILFLKKEFFEF